MLIFILFLLLQVIVSELNYNDCWILKSNFNYSCPSDSYLNIAYPASIAYYYVTLIPPNSNYSFIGKFLEENVYESSLTVYDSNGLLNNNFESINTYNTKGLVNYNVLNDNFGVFYVLQRFYVNFDFYNEEDLINNLFKVYNNNNKVFLPILSEQKRNFYSNMLYMPLETLISWISPELEYKYSKFFLPGKFTGLFPDRNHYYLISYPGKFDIFKISGYFKPEKIFPYVDFITVNQKNVSTDNGLPFYQFLKKDNSYEIYVTSDNIDDNIIYKIDQNANILKWKPDNNYRAIIFRIIDFSKVGITNSTGPLTPDETQKMMGKFYPKITIINKNMKNIDI